MSKATCKAVSINIPQQQHALATPINILAHPFPFTPFMSSTAAVNSTQTLQ